MEVTEQWIGKIAGWKALKAGRSAWKSGSVKHAELSEGGSLLTGTLRGGQRPRPIKIHIHGEFDIENKCSCILARRTGEICEHAVAAMLYAVNGSFEEEWSAPKEKKVELASFDPKAVRVELPPHFPKKLGNGLTLRLVEEDRQLGASDLLICAWLQNLGLKEVPPMLPLRLEDTAGLFVILEGNECVFAGDKRIHFVGSSARIPVEVECDGERLGFTPIQNGALDYIHLAGKLGVWDNEQNLLALPKLERLNAGQVERLANGGSLFLKVKQFLTELENWESAFDWGQSDFLEKLRVLPANPQFILKVDGSLRGISAHLEARYPGGIRLQAGMPKGNDEFPIQDRNHEGLWLMRNKELENVAVRKLMTLGFTLTGSGQWEISNTDVVLDFLSSVETAIESGWTVEMGHRLKSQQSNVVAVKPAISIEEGNQDWLAFDYGFQTQDGRDIPRELIEKMLRAGKRSATTKNGKQVVISSFDAELMGEVMLDVDPRQEGGKFLVAKNQGAYLSRLRAFYSSSQKRPSEKCLADLPKSIRKTLREYQEEGIAWLYQRMEQEGAALLADDMGLGKTLQTLSVVNLVQQSDPRSVLVVCPTSLLENWRSEIEKFYPSKNVLVLHGTKRREQFEQIAKADIVITSYALVARDLEVYQENTFSCVVIDEASVIRNPDTQSAKALRKLDVEKRIALTGTPVENALQDLWSIFHWLMPSYLGKREEFSKRYVKPCAGSDPDISVLRRLRLRIEPFMLRRTKQEVARDLPQKMEQIVWCEPTDEQRAIYARTHEAAVSKVAEAEKLSKGKAKMQMLTALLRLRQVCCDLRLLGSEFSEFDAAQASAKIQRLKELLVEAKAGGHRVLIFSQFTSMLGLIKDQLDEQGMSYCYLDGSTKNRGAVVDQFQKENGPSAFLISLKAGGYGLNLTAADMVVHFDPWWNPAVEAQATDRAYRIGQTKPVNVYKFITRGTVEEKIISLQEKKRGLIGAAVDEQAMMSGLSSTEIDSLLEE